MVWFMIFILVKQNAHKCINQSVLSQCSKSNVGLPSLGGFSHVCKDIKEEKRVLLRARCHC